MRVAALFGLLLILNTLWTGLVHRSVASPADGNALLQVISKWQLARPSSWTGDDPCLSSWKGVACDGSLRVTYLDLSNTGIIGDIPIEIQALDALLYLNVSNNPKNLGAAWNHVTGDLSALAPLKKLQILNATFNGLNGDFPKAVLQLTALTDLHLDNAGLTGPFPEGLSNLGQLQFLYLGNNSMSGSLPSELGSLFNLQELSLWNNIFISTIPVELGNLANLKYMNLHDCHLYGSLPSEFGKLKSIKTLYLYNNALTGSVPDAWGNMQSLQNLRLQSNFLTKQFPSWIESLQSLKYVDISYNLFYGSVTNITSEHLETLNVACNFFTGSTPTGPSMLNLTDAQNCMGNDSQADNRNFCRASYTCTEFNKEFSSLGLCPTCPVTPYPQVPSTETSSCACEKVGEGADKKGENSHTLGILIGSVVGAVLLLVFVVLGFLALKKSRASKGTPDEKTTSIYGSKFDVKGSQDVWEAPQGVQRFSLKELVQATAGFGSEHEIGVGGFGKVFYGVLANGTKVAIKRASATSMQGSTEFRNEVVLLSRLHHRNLVRLEGFCEDNELQILVYEYVPNGNLHTHLFQHDAASSFNWLRRLDVAVGIAQGLDYLHSFADPPVIHRDVKPSNILLDINMVAKVADFGISKSTLEHETHISTTPAGTAGYIDPQYFLRRQLTPASDVYGFGVVLLELVTGQKAIDPNRLEDNYIVEWVKVKLKVDGVEAIVDPRMGNSYPIQVYQEVVQLAVNCAAFNKNERPSMKTAVVVLDNCLRAVCPAPTRVLDATPERHLREGRSAIQILEDDVEQERSEGMTFSSTLSASKSAFQGASLLPR